MKAEPIHRVLEPEVMDTQEEAAEYDAMDHSEVNRKFVQDFLATKPVGTDILDLGTGTALIPVELCLQSRTVRVMASDAAVSMLELARYHLEAEGLRNRIQLHHGDSKKLGFEDNMFDAVISNSLLHHIPEPQIVALQMQRVLKPGGRLFVRDLARPETAEQVEHFVTTYAGTATPTAQQLFRQSLHAALSLDEIRQIITELGFSPEDVTMTSDRHWTWSSLKK
jgi:ubiquinone/menaquinone biosynthesis C-methylase UbiE